MTARRFITLDAERDRLVELDKLVRDFTLPRLNEWLRELSPRDLHEYRSLIEFRTTERERMEARYREAG